MRCHVNYKSVMKCTTYMLKISDSFQEIPRDKSRTCKPCIFCWDESACIYFCLTLHSDLPIACSNKSWRGNERKAILSPSLTYTSCARNPFHTSARRQDPSSCLHVTNMWYIFGAMKDAHPGEWSLCTLWSILNMSDHLTHYLGNMLCERDTVNVLPR